MSGVNYNKIAAKIGQQEHKTDVIARGGARDDLFDTDQANQDKKELNERLKELDYTIDGPRIPSFIKQFTMKDLNCIPYNPDSEFSKKNPEFKAKDTWWTHLNAEYETDGKIVTHNVLAIDNCYMDLNERTSGKLQKNYGESLVNIYIPTDVYAMIHRQIEAVNRYEQLSDGKEIPDTEQGLTSFLCQKGTQGPLNITMYKPVLDDENNIIEYDRVACSLLQVYQSAKESPKYRICGGTAFLRFGLNYGCDPDTFDAKEPLPTSIMPEVKIKLMGFHALTCDGDKLRQITYKKQEDFHY